MEITNEEEKKLEQIMEEIESVSTRQVWNSIAIIIIGLSQFI